MYSIVAGGGYTTTGRCHVARRITNNDNAGPTRTSVRGGATGTAASTTAATGVYSTISTGCSISTSATASCSTRAGRADAAPTAAARSMSGITGNRMDITAVSAVTTTKGISSIGSAAGRI